MKIAIISLHGESSELLAEECKNYFKKVDSLDIRNFEVKLSDKGVDVAYKNKDLENYDCIYIRGSFKYALIQRSITRALSNKTYIPMEPKSFTLGHDKFLTLLELQKNKISIPKTYYAATNKIAHNLIEKAKYPILMKVARGTHGKGVMIAETEKSAKTILDLLEEFKEPYLIQEFVKTKGTSDIRVLVAGNKVIAAYKRKAAENEIRTNIHVGGKRKTHKLTKEEKKLAIQSAKTVGADICGVDILNAKKPSVIEVNLSPSLTNLEDVTGKNVIKEVAKALYEGTKNFKESKRRIKKKK